MPDDHLDLLSAALTEGGTNPWYAISHQKAVQMVEAEKKVGARCWRIYMYMFNKSHAQIRRMSVVGSSRNAERDKKSTVSFSRSSIWAEWDDVTRGKKRIPAALAVEINAELIEQW